MCSVSNMVSSKVYQSPIQQQFEATKKQVTGPLTSNKKLILFSIMLRKWVPLCAEKPCDMRDKTFARQEEQRASEKCKSVSPLQQVANFWNECLKQNVECWMLKQKQGNHKKAKAFPFSCILSHLSGEINVLSGECYSGQGRRVSLFSQTTPPKLLGEMAQHPTGSEKWEEGSCGS